MHGTPSSAGSPKNALYEQLFSLTDNLGWTAPEKVALPALPPPDYLSFLRTSLPTGWTADAPHIRLIVEHLDAVERGEIDRLAIHMPPRHSKSETTTIRYPVYALSRRPDQNVLLTGYNERFARRLGRKARTIAQGRLSLAPDKQAADEWATTAGGVMMTRGVGSPPTGTGFSRIVIDDPIRRREDADSEVYREKVWDWYTDDLYTRLEPGGAIVLVMTLWHEDDIGARAVASEPGRWTVLKLPAIAENSPDRPDALGRPEGAALWPERYDVAALERIRAVMAQNEGERSWQALFQQNPTAREGSFFKVGQIAIEPAAPAILSDQCRAWDMAATEGGGDYTVGALVARAPDGIFWILDIRRGRWATDTRNKEILQAAAMDGTKVRIHGPQDPGSAGKDAAAAFARMLAGYSVKTEPVSGAKVTRADPFSAQVNAGNVRMIKADWNKAVIEELRSFPLGAHDDCVDALSDAFTELATPTSWANNPELLTWLAKR